MRVLITGGTGLLGKALVEHRPGRAVVEATFVGDYRAPDDDKVGYWKLDVRDVEGFRQLFERVRPDVVVHCAAVGSPDFAQRYPAETRAINVGGTATVIDMCRRFGAHLIYVSSNGIYDGERAPYAEEDRAEPVNYYGELKLEAERLVLSSGIPNAVVRPILLYGWNHPFERDNVVTLALRQLREGRTFQAFEDVFANPLFAGQCSDVIWRIAEEGRCGAFNVGGADVVSINDLIARVADAFDLDPRLVVPAHQGDLDALVRRPRNTCLATGKVERELSFRPLSLKEGLDVMKRQEPCRAASF
jgi:dTDP-4-dehydrorhamnose reductase